MTRHVILGGGPAGIHAIETIRQLDPEADLTLVCDEVPCARMVLPYHLAGTIQPGTLFTTDEAWAKDRDVTLEIGCRATSVDAEANEVVLDDGSVLAYDRLLVATGSRAARPPLEGLDSPRVVDMWTVGRCRCVHRSRSQGRRSRRRRLHRARDPRRAREARLPRALHRDRARHPAAHAR